MDKRVEKALARLERFQSKKSWDVRVTSTVKRIKNKKGG